MLSAFLLGILGVWLADRVWINWHAGSADSGVEQVFRELINVLAGSGALLCLTLALHHAWSAVH